ncbi:MAG: alpha/beta fold hydrolase [Nitriliruptorales bacterium]|nr:alpha/beta fold hydrolase [Nitriliruptorales bacterium]
MLEFTRHDGGGEGTLVLLHSLALDRTVWEGMIPLVRDRFGIIALDLPGHGASPRLEEITIEAMADEVAALLRDLGTGPVIVVGLSLSGGASLRPSRRGTPASSAASPCWTPPAGMARPRPRIGRGALRRHCATGWIRSPPFS